LRNAAKLDAGFGDLVLIAAPAASSQETLISLSAKKRASVRTDVRTDAPIGENHYQIPGSDPSSLHVTR
jgi:hypothetical protein